MENRSNAAGGLPAMHWHSNQPPAPKVNHLMITLLNHGIGVCGLQVEEASKEPIRGGRLQALKAGADGMLNDTNETDNQKLKCMDEL